MSNKLILAQLDELAERLEEMRKPQEIWPMRDALADLTAIVRDISEALNERKGEL